jgi:hypothetical protein
MRTHTRYSNAEKINILPVVEKLQSEQHLNLTQAAAHVHINPSIIYKWSKNIEEINRNPKKAAKMAAPLGPTSLVANIEEGQLNFIKQWRQKGFEVHRFALLRKARELKPDVLDHSEGATKIFFHTS